MQDTPPTTEIDDAQTMSTDALTTILANQEMQNRGFNLRLKRQKSYSSVLFFGSRKGTICTRVGQPNLLDATLKPCFASSRLLVFT